MANMLSLPPSWSPTGAGQCHLSWNYCSVAGSIAPHPTLPDAFDQTWCGGRAFRSLVINTTPFQSSMNISHHRRSEWKHWPSLMWWCAFLAPASNSNNLRMNVFPGRTTAPAWANFPTRDSNSTRRHPF